jgi:uncharacterized protein (DUF433 family)
MADVVSLLQRPVYTYPQVDRLLGLTRGTAKRWLNGYTRNRVPYPPILRHQPSETRWVTWGEFVETRFFAGYRDVDNIPAKRMRRIVEVLREQFDTTYPLAYAAPFLYSDGRLLLYQAQRTAELPDEFATEVETGQIVLTPWVDRFVDSVRYDDEEGAVTALRPDADFPVVIADPLRRGGEPVLTGHNVRVATVASLVRGGESIDNVADWYNLSVDEVRQAVHYDRLHPRIA